MDASICWQKAVQDLADDNQDIREQLREITGWFPSIEMMRDHARGLIKPDPTRLASRTERVTDAVLDPEVQIIPPVFTGGNKKKKRETKKPVVGVVRRSERIKNLKNN
ncbi:hypothetical protein ZWY2020_054287 [Hordeum vulgare]|nr:hypothetical protein ZWY2020_054287 [Hordeum vulgare]